jgi:hypothetical protein
MSFRAAALSALTLVAAGAGPAADARQPALAAAGEWTIGPVINGRNYSHRMPLHPTPLARGGWAIDLPQAPGSAHLVTFRHGSLAGKSRIVMRYRVETAPGARIVPKNYPTIPGLITPYFQRSGDNWSARGRFESYRWFATFASQPLIPGEHVLVAPLNGLWTAVETSTARTNPAGFRDAVANADQVGFALGGGDGYSKGIYATGRARLIVTEFRVE